MFFMQANASWRTQHTARSTRVSSRLLGHLPAESRISLDLVHDKQTDPTECVSNSQAHSDQHDTRMRERNSVGYALGADDPRYAGKVGYADNLSCMRGAGIHLIHNNVPYMVVFQVEIFPAPALPLAYAVAGTRPPRALVHTASSQLRALETRRISGLQHIESLVVGGELDGECHKARSTASDKIHCCDDTSQRAELLQLRHTGKKYVRH